MYTPCSKEEAKSICYPLALCFEQSNAALQQTMSSLLGMELSTIAAKPSIFNYININSLPFTEFLSPTILTIPPISSASLFPHSKHSLKFKDKRSRTTIHSFKSQNAHFEPITSEYYFLCLLCCFSLTFLPLFGLCESFFSCLCFFLINLVTFLKSKTE
jgi:hypothetical protein